MSDGMLRLAYAAVLVLARVGAFTAACPAFLPHAAPGRVRNIGVLALTGALTAALPRLPVPDAPYLALGLELLCGISMGLAVRFTTLAAAYAGDLIDVHAGFAFAQHVDPMAEAQVGPVQHFLQTIAGMLFFATGGQHLVIRALAHSLGALPPATLGFQAGTATYLCGRAAEMFVVGLTLAGPVLGALMVLQLGLALLARVAPQLNIWGVGFGVITAAVMGGLYLYAPAWAAAAAGLWREGIGHAGRVWAVSHG